MPLGYASRKISSEQVWYYLVDFLLQSASRNKSLVLVDILRSQPPRKYTRYRWTKTLIWRLKYARYTEKDHNSQSGPQGNDMKVVSFSFLAAMVALKMVALSLAADSTTVALDDAEVRVIFVGQCWSACDHYRQVY
jgi:hypothetical protein